MRADSVKLHEFVIPLIQSSVDLNQVNKLFSFQILEFNLLAFIGISSRRWFGLMACRSTKLSRIQLITRINFNVFLYPSSADLWNRIIEKSIRNCGELYPISPFSNNEGTLPFFIKHTM